MAKHTGCNKAARGYCLSPRIADRMRPSKASMELAAWDVRVPSFAFAV